MNSGELHSLGHILGASKTKKVVGLHEGGRMLSDLHAHDASGLEQAVFQVQMNLCGGGQRVSQQARDGRMHRVNKTGRRRRRSVLHACSNAASARKCMATQVSALHRNYLLLLDSPRKHLASPCFLQSTVSLPCELNGIGMICGQREAEGRWRQKADGGRRQMVQLAKFTNRTFRKRLRLQTLDRVVDLGAHARAVVALLAPALWQHPRCFLQARQFRRQGVERAKKPVRV